MKILKNFGKSSHNLDTSKAKTIHDIAILGYADAAENDELYKSVV